MHWKINTALLAAAVLWFSGCAGEPAPPTPYEAENLSVVVSLGEAEAAGVYTGWMLSEKPDGQGTFQTGDGLTFTGGFTAGTAGEGVVENLPMELVWNDILYAGTYTGELQNGLAHGEGSYTGESSMGFSLEMESGWEAGKPHGEGRVRAELYTAVCSGTKRPGPYEGQILHGLPHGEGSFTGRDETGTFTYTGQWADGLFHGRGSLRYQGNGNYVRQGSFTDGGFTPDYFEALDTVGSYEPKFSPDDSQREFLEQYPGLWDEEHDRRNYLKSEYSKLIDYNFYHSQLFRQPEKYENSWLRLSNCRLIDRRDVSFDNGMTIQCLTAVDGTYTYTYQCYLVGEITEELEQRSRMDMYVVPLGLSHYTNTLGQEVPCAVVLVGDIRIR